MLVLRIVAGVALGYGLIVLLAWLLQERLAFPAPRAPVPDPRRLGIAHGERIELVSGDGTRLAGWYLAPRAADALHHPAPPSPALDRKSTRLNSSHLVISYAVFCLKKKNSTDENGTVFDCIPSPFGSGIDSHSAKSGSPP